MIQIDIMVMGTSTQTLLFQNKATAKNEYVKYRDTISCYAQVSVDGLDLTLAQTLKYFGLPAIIRHTPREASQDCKLPHYKWQRR